MIAKGKLREHIREVNAEEGTTIFITSHDAGDVETLAERVIVISEGEVIFDGPVQELRRRFLTTKRLEAQFAEPNTADFGSNGSQRYPWRVVTSEEFKIVLDLDSGQSTGE